VETNTPSPAASGLFRFLLLDLAYGCGLAVASPFLAYKLLTSERYRSGLRQRLGDVPSRPGEKPCLWIHAASVGEVQAARPLVKECRERWPGLDFAVSTQTASGQEIARKHLPNCLVFYFPLDLCWIAAKVIDRIRPTCIALVEREVWPNFVAVAARSDVPVVQVNSRLSESSLRAYRWLRPAFGPALQAIGRFVTQSEAYSERLRQLGIPAERIVVAGNLKYDGVPTSIPEDVQERLRQEMGIQPGEPVLVGGSVHPPEILPLVQAYQLIRRSRPGLRLVLAPRHLERVPEVESAIAGAGESSVRKTELARPGTPPGASKGKIIIVDTIGELRAVYSLATVVFVGGTLVPIGGHNIVEPAALGKPVVFGPHIFAQAADAEAFVAASAAIRCPDGETVAKQLDRLFNDASCAEDMGRRGQAVLRSNQGAARKTVEVLAQYLPTG
jgi:3-deoxy-D-manno-octulosonic-acid transferase